MRISLHRLLILCLPLLAGCSGGDKPPKSSPPERALPPVLFRAYFTGTTRLIADTNAAPWVSLAALPESQALWRQTLGKLAQAPHQLVCRRTTATNDFALTFQELIADLVRAESFVEVAGDTNHLAEIEFGVRLPVDRAEYWRTNLLTIIENWTAGRGQALPAGSVGWEITSPSDKGVFRLIRAGNWTLLGWGKEQLPLQDEFRKRIGQTGSPATVAADSWVEIYFDGPNLASVLPLLSLSPSDGERAGVWGAFHALGTLPAANLALARRGSDLRLSGNLIFRDPFSWQLEPWQIPTNLIHDPIISFTAAQGIAPLLRKQQAALGLSLDPLPNQLFVWSGAMFPVQTLAAAPVPNAPQFIRNLGPQLMSRFNPRLEAQGAGRLQMITNSSGANALRWIGIPPFVVPYLTTANDSGVDFLVAGIHPNWAGTNLTTLAPLFQHVSIRTNLIYYDWEITAEHAWAWRSIVNIFRHIFEQPRLKPDTTSIVCLNAVSNRLGNTITEVTRSNSNQLDFVRQGPVCLTGLELIALAHWLESSNFPLGGIDLPAPTNTVSAP